MSATACLCVPGLSARWGLGIFHLHLAKRSMLKIEAILRDEMDRLGCRRSHAGCPAGGLVEGDLALVPDRVGDGQVH